MDEVLLRFWLDGYDSIEELCVIFGVNDLEFEKALRKYLKHKGRGQQNNGKARAK